MVTGGWTLPQVPIQMYFLVSIGKYANKEQSMALIPADNINTSKSLFIIIKK